MNESSVTEALSRPRHDADHARTKNALLDLAARMAREPAAVLPKLVDHAMEMAGGSSAGLSLYEPEPSPGVFRWMHLRGAMSHLEGGRTPRNDSPCGVTLDQRRPLVCRHPEQIYGWLADARVSIPEALLVPLYVGGEEPFGTLWIVSDEEDHFDSGHVEMASEVAGFAGLALRMLSTEEKLRRSCNEQELFATDMRHRLMNFFVRVEALVRLSATETDSKSQLVELISGRIHALADAFQLLRTSPAADPIFPKLELDSIVKRLLRPYNPTAKRSAPRVVVQGPSIACGERATTGLALIFNELATNSIKYGALVRPDGQVLVGWRTLGQKLMLEWDERGPSCEKGEPAQGGFGLGLLQTATELLGGRVQCAWRSHGLLVQFEFDLARISE